MKNILLFSIIAIAVGCATVQTPAPTADGKNPPATLDQDRTAGVIDGTAKFIKLILFGPPPPVERPPEVEIQK